MGIAHDGLAQLVGGGHRQLGELGAREPDQHGDGKSHPPHPGQPAQVLAEHRPDGGREQQRHNDELEKLEHHCRALQEPGLIQLDLARPRDQLDDVTDQPGRRGHQGPGDHAQDRLGGVVGQGAGER